MELVLLRHGQSVWNRENRFTGWTDVPLSADGKREARKAGQLLLEQGLRVDVVYTSVLLRAIHTAEIALRELGLHWIQVRRHWRLNERHYGEFQGRNKREMVALHGSELVRSWRRSYDQAPPAVALTDKRHPRHDMRYATLPVDLLPSTERLADVVHRLLPYWQDRIRLDMLAGRRPFIVAHGNSLRALVMHLDQLSAGDVIELNIPTGIPLVYKFNSSLEPISRRYLGEQGLAEAAAKAVANEA